MKLYKSIYDGNAMTFNLTQCQPMMKMNKNFTVSTLSHFQRTINMTYAKGKRHHYLDYYTVHNLYLGMN